LTVPPGIWFGFKGISDDLNLICNVANMSHDPNEVMRKDIDEIKMDWSIK
jgi:dTDP-4-dehydrorhamnose 3,5-epimerase